MMESQVDRELLEKIADLVGKPIGAFNIRKDSGCDGRQSTEHIEITGKTDGKSGIDIRIKDGTKGEQCHIPVIITKPGIQEMVYNDFYIGEDCDVDIVAGCGIHNCGAEASRHDGLHTFYVGKNSHVKYTEKHYGEGDGTGGRIMNPLSGGGRLHSNGDRADSRHRLHKAGNKDRLRQKCRGGGHGAAHDPWRSGGRKRYGNRS